MITTKPHDFYCPRCRILLLPEQIDFIEENFSHTIDRDGHEEVHRVIEQP